jgi:hypothetical protein
MDFQIRLGLVAAATAVVLAGCAATPPRQDARSAVRADRQIEAQASAFEAFMRNARAIDDKFPGPAAVTEGLKVGAAYNPKQMEAGMIAYAAVAALQDPKFVAGVRKAGKDKQLAKRLISRPDLATSLPGADAGAARANAALYRQGEALNASGMRVKKVSYSIQHQAWSQVFVPDAKGRLTRVKQISSAGYRPVAGDDARLYAAVDAGRRGGGASPVVARGLAVAALTVLGEGSKAKGLLNEPKSGMCLRVAKLNLYQCLASAGPYYEDIYCLAMHGMMEPSSCATKASGAPIRTALR